MSKKARYFLLCCGIFIFIVFAPLMVLYVTGFKYDVKAKGFVKTGILAIRSDPGSVNVLLDGKLIKKSAGDIKFLSPGEYNLTLQKTDYQDWSKRFFVDVNQVTWANPSPNKLFLFRKNSEPHVLTTGVTAMYVAGSNILYLSPQGLSVSPVDNSTQITNFSLKNPATSMVSSPNHENFILLNSTDKNSTTSTAAIFNLRSKTLTDIGRLFTKPFTLQFSDNNELYALSDNTVYKIDVPAIKKTEIANSVQNFTVVQGNLYYLQKIAATSSLMSLPLTAGGQPQLLISGIPSFSTSSLMVNFQKQILILLDSTLYRASNILIPVTEDVSEVSFDQAGGSVLVLHSGQLDFYNYDAQNLNFITRTGLPIKNFLIRPDLNYAFFYKNTSLEALELDLRDHQNEYKFYTATNPQTFMLDNDGKNIYILDDGKLMVQVIR
jgi:hypothetical protein